MYLHGFHTDLADESEPSQQHYVCC